MPNAQRSKALLSARLSARSSGGFTLIEIMVVIGIIALLAALGTVSIPAYMRRWRGGACATNLQLIQAAKRSWAFEHPNTAMPADPTAAGGLADYLPGRTIPRCPGGGTYSDVTTLGTRCSCSLNTANGASACASADVDVGGPDWAHNNYHDLGPE